jgi:RNA polymerase sigma-70 factor (ECF subfamily)
MGGVVEMPGRRATAAPRELAHLSDEALLALIGRHDDLALAELYSRHGRLAYGLAFRILRDDALAQDAVQEAFLAVWRGAGRFTAEKAKPTTWLLTLVHRRAVDLVRREEKRRADPLDPDVGTAAAAPADQAEDLGRREAVRAALRELPPEQREAIELAYYGGYTQSELAERLGQPIGTIKSRMFTGLARLRDALGDQAAVDTAL